MTRLAQSGMYMVTEPETGKVLWAAIGNPREKIRIEPMEVPVPEKTPAPVETPVETPVKEPA